MGSFALPQIDFSDPRLKLFANPTPPANAQVSWDSSAFPKLPTVTPPNLGAQAPQLQLVPPSTDAKGLPTPRVSNLRAVPPSTLTMPKLNGLAAVPNLGAPSSGPSVQSPAMARVTARDALIANGHGISHIDNPWLRGFARVGDAALRIAAPVIEQNIPGTVGNYNQHLAKANAKIGVDQTQAQNDAQIAQTQANTAYAQQRPEIEQSKIDQKQAAVQQRVAQEAAARGQHVEFDADGVPTFTDNPDLQEYQVNAARMTLQQAQTERQQVMASAGQPGTPLYEQKQHQQWTLQGGKATRVK